MNRSHNTGFVTFDFAEMTSRKSYIHKRNAKRDGTWRNYNNLPTPDIIKKKKKLANWSSGICQAGYAFVTQGFVAVKRHDTRNLLCSDELNSP